MAVHFYPLTVKKIRRETPECITVSFDLPENLQSEFAYREGQNITIRHINCGEELRRSYSICTAPYENELKVAIKKVEGGAFSAYANEQLKTGDQLEVMPPTGKFNSHGTIAGNFLAIAAGSGITPVISIIKHTLQTNPGSSFTLIYGNRTRSSIIFFDELEGLKNKYMQRFNLVNILSREQTDAEINYGRLNESKLAALKTGINYKAFDEIYLCGPEEVIFAAERFLKAEGLSETAIHFELFTTYGQKAGTSKANTATIDTGLKSRVRLKVDGRTIEFPVPYNGESILDAALKQGADLPYACKGGVCCTCRARLIEGEVHMDVNYALEPGEVAQGFILTCQSHPLTEKLSIDFDVK